MNFPRNLLSFNAQQRWEYPDGAIGVRLPKGSWPDEGMFRIQNASDLVTFIMAMDAREEGPLDHVTIPFLPYARQDRVTVDGDPLALRVFCNLIAEAGVKAVTCLDAHSEAARRFFGGSGVTFESVSPVPYIQRYLNGIAPIHPAGFAERFILVAPDKGALHKTFQYALDIRDRIDGVVVCQKQRDPITGRLSKFEVQGYHPRPDISLAASGNTFLSDIPFSPLPLSGTLVIVDDICDGGGTFAGVKEALTLSYGERAVHLWTTHGIYSKGIDHLLDQFATIGSTDSFLSTAPGNARRYCYDI